MLDLDVFSLLLGMIGIVNIFLVEKWLQLRVISKYDFPIQYCYVWYWNLNII